MYQVKCPECGKERFVEAKKPWMVGEQPFLKVCMACCQKGKERTRDCRLKISAALRSQSAEKDSVGLDQFESDYSGFLSTELITIKCGVEGCNGVETLRKDSAALNIKKNNVFKCRTCCFTEEGKKKMGEASSYKRSQETCDKMAAAKKAFYETEKGKELKQKLSEIAAAGHAVNKYENSKRQGWFKSVKMNKWIFFGSSYELRLCWLLEQDENVDFFETQIGFNWEGRGRCLDCLVTFKDRRKKAIEVKPLDRVEEFKEQISDSRMFSAKNGWDFEVYTETNFGMPYHQIRNWADDYRQQLTGIDYTKHRKEMDSNKAKKYYDTHIATDKVSVFCEYCQVTHEALRLTHDKNIARNGKYICEREGGHIAGSRPKPHLRKENPHAADGKKECLGCKQVLALSEYGADKGRADGYASKCKECRRVAANDKYAKKTR